MMLTVYRCDGCGCDAGNDNFYGSLRPRKHDGDSFDLCKRCFETAIEAVNRVLPSEQAVAARNLQQLNDRKDR